MESEQTDSLYDYTAKVHQSLEHPIQTFGIGANALLIIVMATTLLATLISVWLIAAGVIALLVTKKLCKKESLLVDFLIQNLGYGEVYKG